MKKFNLLLLIATLLCSISCKENTREITPHPENGNEENSFPPHNYRLNLQVFDKSGKNMVENFKLSDKASDGYLYEIINPPKVELSTPGTSFHGGADIKTVIKTDKYHCASINAGVFTEAKGFADKLAFKLSDDRLFGDSKEHIFETEWELQPGGNTVCKLVKFDGKSYPVAEDKNAPGITSYIIVIQL